MPPAREYPDAPRAAVGAVVLDEDRVLLVRRGQPPGLGKWSLPGGLLDLGERLEDAVVREVEEESGLRVQVLGLCGVIDRVIPGEHADSGAPRSGITGSSSTMSPPSSAASSGRAVTPRMPASFPSPSSAATKPPTGSPR